MTYIFLLMNFEIFLKCFKILASELDNYNLVSNLNFLSCNFDQITSNFVSKYQTAKVREFLAWKSMFAS